MTPLRWFQVLPLRWRIPLGAVVLLAGAAGFGILVAWLHYRQCRHLDLIDLVPSRLPLVARCRDGGAHWDRIREGGLARVLEAQVRRRGPFVQWIEAAAGASWDDLTARAAAGPAAAFLTEARLRGLLGKDVVAAVASGAVPGGSRPPAVLLTRIGFAEYLALPVVRWAVARRPEAAGSERYRRVTIDRLALPPARGDSSGGSLVFAVKGDILAAATDPDLLKEVLDRTFKDWAPPDDGVAPWALPEGVPLALGADMHRLPPSAPEAPPGLREVLGMFPVREALLPLDPDALGRLMLGIDVVADGLRIDGTAALREGRTPMAPVLPEAGALPPLAAVPEDAIAFVEHRVPFPDALAFVESVTLDAGRRVAAADALGNPFSFFQRQARDIELPALRSNGLATHLLPRLRGGLVLVLTREAGPPPASGDVPNQTGLALIGTAGGPDAAETALHDLLQARTAPLNARVPNDVTETLLPAGDESVRFLRRRSWPAQVAYGEARGVLAVGIRPDAVVRAHETLIGAKPDVARAPRYRSVRAALDAGDPGAASGDARRISRLYVDLRRLGALLREVAPDLARFAKDRVDGPRLRAALERRSPRQPAEDPAAYARRITGLFEAEMKRVVDDARLRIEAPAMLLDPFGAAGLEIAAEGSGYHIRGVLLLP